MAKKQRQKKQWNALYERVCDIMAGACQGDDPTDEEFCAGATVLPNIVWGIELRLLPKDYKEKQAFLTSIYNADKYVDAVELTDFLFRRGIRA